MDFSLLLVLVLVIFFIRFVFCQKQISELILSSGRARSLICISFWTSASFRSSGSFSNPLKNACTYACVVLLAFHAVLCLEIILVFPLWLFVVYWYASHFVKCLNSDAEVLCVSVQLVSWVGQVFSKDLITDLSRSVGMDSSGPLYWMQNWY